MIPEPLGGAFGGKFALVEPLAAGAALALRRPVRLVLTRGEDFQATNPASAQVSHVKVGARKDGTFTAIEGRMIVDRGSNAGWGVEGITSLLVAGPYRWEAHDIRGYGVQTNRFTFGAYRAPGAPTAAFALESLLDELATKLGLDPIEMRLKNAVVEGDIGVSGNPYPTVGAVEVLERIREHPLWTARDSLPGERGSRDRGRYLARRERARSGRLPRQRRRNDDRRHLRRRHERREHWIRGDRRRCLRPLAGQGSRRHRRYVVRPVLGSERRLEDHVHRGQGRASEPRRPRARRCSTAASQELEIAPDDLEVVDGVVRAVGAPDRSITVEEVAKKTLRFGGRHEPIEGHGGSAQTSGAPSVAAHLSHVRVDP